MRHLALSLGCLLLSSTCLAQTTNWVQVQTVSPPPRYGQALAFDVFRGRTVLFGGWTGAAFPKGTWTFDGKNWTQMQPTTVPSGRSNHKMVFDLARGRTVMFGGTGFGGYLNDTWTWDGKDWTQMKPKKSPPARAWHGMAYDSGRGRTVLFGGGDRAGYILDTWEWDGRNWTQVMTRNSPPIRGGHAMVYDAARKRVVLFGGGDNGKNVFGYDDTWEYDGKDWVEVKPATRPSKRFSHGMAYDTARRRTVMFGGAFGLLQETWEYDGNNWVKMSPLTQPAHRWDNELLVYDSRRQRMVLFGGLTWNRQKPLVDTWENIPAQLLTGSPSTISIATGGQHRLALNAGKPHGLQLYWIFGSITGTSPGVTLASPAGSVTIPLNPDPWTDITIGLANTALLFQFRGTLGLSGKAQAWFNVPKIASSSAIGVRFYHAALVYDAQGNLWMASNPATLTLSK